MVSMVLLTVASFGLLLVWYETLIVGRIAAARVARHVRVLRSCRRVHRLLLVALVCLVLVVVPRASSHKVAEACCVHVSCCHRCGC